MKRATLACCLLLTLALVACGGNATPTAAPGQTPTAKTGVWTIGAVGPFSGGNAVWGAALERGMRMYADEVNASGGVAVGDTTYTIEVVTCDAQGSTPGGKQCAEKLVVADGVEWVVGPIGSAECQGWQTVTEPLKAISTIPSGCWANAIIGPDHPGQFRYIVSNREQGPVQMDYLKQHHPEGQTIAFIAYDDPTGHDSVAQLRAAAEAIGYHSIVAEEYAPRETVDFNAYITRMLLRQPDIVYPVVLGDNGTALFFKQLHEQGFDGLKMSFCSSQSLCNEIAGTEPFEGALVLGTPDYCSQELGTPEELAFCNAYEAKFGELPSSYAINAINVMQLYTKMAQGAGSIMDLERAVDWYEDNPNQETSMSGQAHLGGMERYGIARQIFTTLAVSRVENGAIVPETRAESAVEP
jgi:branched-chain amino acid transport system substrate-binding protein